MQNYKELDKQYIIPTYNRMDLLICKGQGSVCYDQNNKEYIDLGSGIGVNSFGYCDTEWANAVANQAQTLSHTSNLYYTMPNVQLAQLLCQKTGYNKVFFANSGAEANEGAIKIARKYSWDKYGKGRDKIITLINSFHGRTMATLTATGQEVFHQYFYPFLDGFDYALANDIDNVVSKIDNSVCAVIIELVQGEGGVTALDKDFVEQLYNICNQKDILLIVDEVQTGVGRVGKFLASEHYGIKPNITTLAKGLGGGLPIGAILCDSKTEYVLTFGTHGTTFGGNPITCAGAISIVERMNNEFLQEVDNKGKLIVQMLNKCQNIESISGLGMMIGIKLKNKNAPDIVRELIANGVIVLTAKDKIRLLPPLNISYEHLEKALNIIAEIIG